MAYFNCLVNQNGQTLRIEIYVGERCEDGVDGERVNLRIGYALLPGAVGVHGDPFDAVDQEILKNCSGFVFTADA